MKYFFAALIALVLFAGSAAAAPKKEAPKITGPLKVLRAPIDLKLGKYPQLYVVFNHNTHKGVKCLLCHHMQNSEGQLYSSCTSEGCHDIPGPRNDDPMSAFMAWHDPASDHSCYGCHKKEAAYYPQFKGCRPCHISPLAREAEAKDAATGAGTK